MLVVGGGNGDGGAGRVVEEEDMNGLAAGISKGDHSLNM